MKKRVFVLAVLAALFNVPALAGEAARPAASKGAKLTVSQVAGTWYGVGYGRGEIVIRKDGTYLRDGEPGGKYKLEGDHIVFAGRLAVWGGGRATIDEKGILTFYWDQDGWKLVMTFAKK